MGPQSGGCCACGLGTGAAGGQRRPGARHAACMAAMKPNTPGTRGCRLWGREKAGAQAGTVQLSNALLKWHAGRAEVRQGQAVTAEKRNAGKKEKRAAGKKDASRFGQLGG